MADLKHKVKDFDSGNDVNSDLKGYSFKDFINGQILSRGFLWKHFSYIVFLVLLAFIYINNHYSVEKLLKEQIHLTREVRELKYEAITTSSELMQMSRQSEVIRRTMEAGLGLEVLKVPPRVLTVEKK